MGVYDSQTSLNASTVRHLITKYTEPPAYFALKHRVPENLVKPLPIWSYIMYISAAASVSTREKIIHVPVYRFILPPLISL